MQAREAMGLVRSQTLPIVSRKRCCHTETCAAMLKRRSGVTPPPRVARFWPQSGCIPQSVHVGPNSADSRIPGRVRPVFAEFRATSVEFGPMSTIGRCRSRTEFGRCGAKFGSSSTEVGNFWSESPRIRSSSRQLARCRRNASIEFAPKLVDAVPSVPSLDQFRPNPESAKVGPMSAEIAPKSRSPNLESSSTMGGTKTVAGARNNRLSEWNNSGKTQCLLRFAGRSHIIGLFEAPTAPRCARICPVARTPCRSDDEEMAISTKQMQTRRWTRREVGPHCK